MQGKGKVIIGILVLFFLLFTCIFGGITTLYFIEKSNQPHEALKENYRISSDTDEFKLLEIKADEEFEYALTSTVNGENTGQNYNEKLEQQVTYTIDTEKDEVTTEYKDLPQANETQTLEEFEEESEESSFISDEDMQEFIDNKDYTLEDDEFRGEDVWKFILNLTDEEDDKFIETIDDNVNKEQLDQFIQGFEGSFIEGSNIQITSEIKNETIEGEGNIELVIYVDKETKKMVGGENTFDGRVTRDRVWSISSPDGTVDLEVGATLTISDYYREYEYTEFDLKEDISTGIIVDFIDDIL